jgi:hypothetical protein
LRRHAPARYRGGWGRGDAGEDNVPLKVDDASLPGVLQLVFTGPITVAERAQAFEACLAWVATHQPRRVLVDFTGGWPAPAEPEAAARHAENLAKAYTSLGGARIAYLSKPERRDPSPIELQAAARGYFYQRFTDRDAALRWLNWDASPRMR